MFIVFEGGDGCGKSTQLTLAQNWLTQQGHDCLNCCDPGTTELGQRVRALLLDHDDFDISNRAEMLLFMVARAQLIEELVSPAIQNNTIVLCDRFVLSTVVYQGYAGKISAEDIYSVGSIATNNVTPDLTLVFDLPVDAAMARVGPVKDRLESRGKAYFEMVREGYLSEANKRSEKTKVIDASQSIEEIHSEVKEHINDLLEKKI